MALLGHANGFAAPVLSLPKQWFCCACGCAGELQPKPEMEVLVPTRKVTSKSASGRKTSRTIKYMDGACGLGGEGGHA
eukprot:1140855-Pelagomonas_calceolata.AAC.3